jgi:pimeloyl-[acyl-carrier protein] synthase
VRDSRRPPGRVILGRPSAGNPLQDPAFAQDPYPFYERLRARSPVHAIPLPVPSRAGVWLLTRHADVEAVLVDEARRFTVRRREADVFKLYDSLLPPGIADGPLGTQSMLLQDPPAHSRSRGLVSRAFTPSRIAALAVDIEAHVTERLDAALERGEVDWMHDVAEPMPAMVIAQLLGVPPEDHRLFRKWSSALIEGGVADRAARADEVTSTVETLLDYLRQHVAARRRDPRDDLLSELIRARDAEDALSEEELIATAFLLLVAGHETSTNLIGNGLLALLENPDQLDWLRGDPAARVDNAVEELLRYDGPVQITMRVAREPVSIAGVAIEAGALVMCALGAANRDPQVFADPDRVDLRREEIPHLSFGAGAHYCIGASLARLEGRVAFRVLAERVRGIELIGGAPEYRDNPIVRGLRSLPVRLSP